MQATKTLILTGAALVAALLAGCDNRPAVQALPEVNEENCRPENIAKLDKDVQQELSSQCLRRGSFKPSEQKTW